MLTLDADACYRALTARDRRFDGVFFVGVKTTGVYCRPLCPARTPKPASCRFFSTAALAELAGFRPCLRCRPELAPGLAPVDSRGRLAQWLTRRIEGGALDAEDGLESLARELGISSRQVRRVIHDTLGVPPVALAQTRRLLLAKQLLTQTALPMTRVAFASGFSSLRRFNAAFQERYRLSPTSIRRQAVIPAPDDALELTLGYRPPLAWGELLSFMAARQVAGVESISNGVYSRTVRIDGHDGWMRVRGGGDDVRVTIALALMPVVGTVLARVRALFDLNARPDVVASHLGGDRLLLASVSESPGLRVPGCFDAFEIAWRAVLGQQVSVRAATTLASRFAEAFGDSVERPFAGLTRLTPTAERVAAASIPDLTRLGIVRARAQTIVSLAQFSAVGKLNGVAAAQPEAWATEFQRLPGIGPWTAGYVAMRVLGWPDAFPRGDLGLLRAARVKSSSELDELAEAWRPWRAYAAMHLWRSSAGAPTPAPPKSNGVVQASDAMRTAVRRARRAAEPPPIEIPLTAAGAGK
ncbi:MAG: AlkA N-terminal domain-containing protein [Phycisphaerae bacterium]